MSDVNGGSREAAGREVPERGAGSADRGSSGSARNVSPRFAVLYRWRLVPGREAEFERAWADLTQRIAAAGGLGSRLHRAADGTHCAYAQWPSRKAWESLALEGDDVTALREAMSNAVAETLPTETFDVLRDLLAR